MQNTEKYYDQLAAIYDTATAEGWHAPNQVEKITKFLSDKDTNILDIGIGTGQSIQEIFSNNQFKSIEGIDTSGKMLEICKTKYPSIQLHYGEFLSYENFSLDSYDLIICCGALEFIPDLNQFFKKCKQLLSSKSNLVLTYEPRIYAHKIQAKSKSGASSERVNEVADFVTFRYNLNEFNEIAANNGFEILKNELFVSYRKLDSDIIYSLVHLVLK